MDLGMILTLGITGLLTFMGSISALLCLGKIRALLSKALERDETASTLLGYVVAICDLFVILGIFAVFVAVRTAAII